MNKVNYLALRINKSKFVCQGIVFCSLKIYNGADFTITKLGHKNVQVEYCGKQFYVSAAVLKQELDLSQITDMLGKTLAGKEFMIFATKVGNNFLCLLSAQKHPALIERCIQQQNYINFVRLKPLHYYEFGAKSSFLTADTFETTSRFSDKILYVGQVLRLGFIEKLFGDNYISLYRDTIINYLFYDECNKEFLVAKRLQEVFPVRHIKRETTFSLRHFLELCNKGCIDKFERGEFLQGILYTFKDYEYEFDEHIKQHYKKGLI